MKVSLNSVALIAAVFLSVNLYARDEDRRILLPQESVVGYVSGGVSIDYSGDFLRIRLDALRNVRATATGPLRVAAVWSLDGQTGVRLASFDLAGLPVGGSVKKIDSGFLPYVRPPGYNCGFHEYLAIYELQNGTWYGLDLVDFGFNQCNGVGVAFTPGLAIPRLLNGETATALKAKNGDQLNFVIFVPPGQTALKVQSMGGVGNADLYLKYGAVATPQNYDERSSGSTSDEIVTHLNPASGFWYVTLDAKTPIADVSLRPEYGDNRSCVALDPFTSCLLGSRFSVTLTVNDSRVSGGATAPGYANLTAQGDYGYFDVPAATGTTDRPVVFVKLIDGRPVNGMYWVFYGGLTDIAYSFTVTDLMTGAKKSYSKPTGTYDGRADTSAFPGP